MVSFLLPAMNVLSLYVGPVMSMREEREIRLALSVKPDTSASKVRPFHHFLVAPLNSCINLKSSNLLHILQVVLGLKVMKMKMTSMIWTTNLITVT